MGFQTDERLVSERTSFLDRLGRRSDSLLEPGEGAIKVQPEIAGGGIEGPVEISGRDAEIRQCDDDARIHPDDVDEAEPGKVGEGHWAPARGAGPMEGAPAGHRDSKAARRKQPALEGIGD